MLPHGRTTQPQPYAGQRTTETRALEPKWHVRQTGLRTPRTLCRAPQRSSCGAVRVTTRCVGLDRTHTSMIVRCRWLAQTQTQLPRRVQKPQRQLLSRQSRQKFDRRWDDERCRQPECSSSQFIASKIHQMSEHDDSREKQT